MNILLVVPFVTPLVAGTVALLLSARRAWRRAAMITGAVGHAGSTFVLCVQIVRSGSHATQLGGWPAPFGITFVADPLSAGILVGISIVGFCGALYSLASVSQSLVERGYDVLYMVLVAGATGATLVGDVFSMYVMIEVMLTASFVLLGLGGRRLEMEGAFKYVVLNLIASALLLSAVGLLYRAAGTLNMAELSVRLQAFSEPRILQPIAMLFLVALGIKCAVFPLYFWLPASYHTPPAVVSAVFAGLLTKVGIYLLLRMFTVVFQLDQGLQVLLLAVAGLTMVSGVLGAIVQQDFRRILAVHIISQVGYMVMGLALYTRLGIAAAIYFTIHNMVVKTNLFFVAGWVRRLRGTYALDRLGGIYLRHGWLAALFLLPALSLAGMPPLSGFIGKLALLEASLGAEAYVLAGVSLMVSVWTLFSMIKIWNEVFWKPEPRSEGTVITASATRLAGARDQSVAEVALMAVPCLLLTLASLGLGIFAGPTMKLCLLAADQLLDPRPYLDAVLGVAADGAVGAGS